MMVRGLSAAALVAVCLASGCASEMPEGAPVEVDPVGDKADRYGPPGFIPGLDTMRGEFGVGFGETHRSFQFRLKADTTVRFEAIPDGSLDVRIAIYDDIIGVGTKIAQVDSQGAGGTEVLERELRAGITYILWVDTPVSRLSAPGSFEVRSSCSNADACRVTTCEELRDYVRVRYEESRTLPVVPNGDFFKNGVDTPDGDVTELAAQCCYEAGTPNAYHWCETLVGDMTIEGGPVERPTELEEAGIAIERMSLYNAPYSYAEYYVDGDRVYGLQHAERRVVSRLNELARGFYGQECDGVPPAWQAMQRMQVRERSSIYYELRDGEQWVTPFTAAQVDALRAYFGDRPLKAFRGELDDRPCGSNQSGAYYLIHDIEGAELYYLRVIYAAD